MTDSKLVAGVLIAACVCLLVANAITWADVVGYGKCEKEAEAIDLPAPTHAPAREAAVTPPAAEADETVPAELGTAPEEGAAPE